MPHIVTWSPQAVSGIQKAYRFLAEKDTAAAKAAAKAAAQVLLKQANILEAFPNAGRPVDDLEPEHRELLVPFGATGYVLLYCVNPEDALVTVLSVRHQKEVGY